MPRVRYLSHNEHYSVTPCNYKGPLSVFVNIVVVSLNAFYWLPSHLLSCRYHMTSMNMQWLSKISI